MLPFGLTGGKLLLFAGIALATVALLFGLYKSIYNNGYRDGYAKLTSYIEEQAKATRVTEKAVEKVAVAVEIKYVDRIKYIKVKGDTIIERVPTYVTKDDDSACELRVGFVRVHDSAARNQPAEPAADTDRTAAGIALAETAAIIAENYKIANVWREQVIGWQEFWTRYVEAVKTAGCVPN